MAPFPCLLSLPSELRQAILQYVSPQIICCKCLEEDNLAAPQDNICQKSSQDCCKNWEPWVNYVFHYDCLQIDKDPEYIFCGEQCFKKIHSSLDEKNLIYFTRAKVEVKSSTIFWVLSTTCTR